MWRRDDPSYPFPASDRFTIEGCSKINRLVCDWLLEICSRAEACGRAGGRGLSRSFFTPATVSRFIFRRRFGFVQYRGFKTFFFFLRESIGGGTGTSCAGEGARLIARARTAKVKNSRPPKPRGQKPPAGGKKLAGRKLVGKKLAGKSYGGKKSRLNEQSTAKKKTGQIVRENIAGKKSRGEDDGESTKHSLSLETSASRA